MSYESVLSAEEREKSAQFYFEKDRTRYIVAHGALRFIIAKYLDSPPERLVFRRNHYGKPSVHDDAFSFNMSHSGDLVLMAIVKNRPIGVDVEMVKDGIDYMSVVENYFSDMEVAMLKQIPDSFRRNAFFYGWTRKEAYIKAKGMGLSIPLKSFTVSLAPGQPAALLDHHEDRSEVQNWTLKNIQLNKDYSAAVAVRGNGVIMQNWLWQFNKKELAHIPSNGTSP